MSDTISRQAAISHVDDVPYIKEHPNVGLLWKAWIESLPSAQSEQRWIPCSERLPRARESVLLAVNHKYGNWVGEGCYWETTDNHIIWKGYRWNATYWDDEIIAWMPLPEPYKAESEGEK